MIFLSGLLVTLSLWQQYFGTILHQALVNLVLLDITAFLIYGNELLGSAQPCFFLLPGIACMPNQPEHCSLSLENWLFFDCQKGPSSMEEGIGASGGLLEEAACFGGRKLLSHKKDSSCCQTWHE